MSSRLVPWTRMRSSNPQLITRNLTARQQSYPCSRRGFAASVSLSAESESSSSSKDPSKAPQPKIYSAKPPDDADAPEEVRKHNEEVAARAARQQGKAPTSSSNKEKVDPGHWSGEVAGKKQ